MIEKLILLIKKEQEALAGSAMRFPETTNATLIAGKWQGLDTALTLISQVINESEPD